MRAGEISKLIGYQNKEEVMEKSEKILYHATFANLHLQELIDANVPDLSTASEALLKDAAHLTDGLAEIHQKISRGG